MPEVVQISLPILSVIAAASGISLLGLILLAVRQSRQQKIWQGIVGGESRAELEAMLTRHSETQKTILSELDEVRTRLDLQERKMQSAKRYVGLVRFNAFDEVGGEQSFALAVFDEEGDGWVLSSLVGRESTRTYCKALVKGQAEQNLSREEQEAIERGSRSTGARR